MGPSMFAHGSADVPWPFKIALRHLLLGMSVVGSMLQAASKVVNS
jgi:hypothetical protein